MLMLFALCTLRVCVVNLCVQVVAAKMLCRDTTAGQMQSVFAIDVAQQLPKVDTSWRTRRGGLTHASVVVQQHSLASARAVDPPVRREQAEVATASVHAAAGRQLTF